MQSVPQAETKAAVRDFWDRQPCGSAHAEAGEGTPEYYQQVERRRNDLEPFIERFARFEAAHGQRVLEIGVGLGTDFVRFARAGATVTGIDLSSRAVDLVRQRLVVEELPGDVRIADAEQLPFEDGGFDVVYSWGVLHHTPNPSRAMREAVRMLRPGGRLCLMVYARHSWVAFALWVRYALLRGRPNRSLSWVLACHMESPGTRAYTPRELRRIFADMEDVRVEHVGTPYDRQVAGPVARLTARRLGWFLVVSCHRPVRATRGHLR